MNLNRKKEEMMEKVKISKIELIVNGKKIELTINEAMELKDLLNKTFEKEKVVSAPYPVYPFYPVYPWWYDPYKIIYSGWITSYSGNTLTYNNTSGG